MIPKGVLRHAEIPRDIRDVKNADYKIRSFLTKNIRLAPGKKVDFSTKYKYSFIKLAIESVCLKTSHETLFRSPGEFYDTPGSLGT